MLPTSGAEHPLRGDQLDRGAPAGQQLGRVECRLRAVVVVDQHATLRVGRTGHDVPGVGDQVLRPRAGTRCSGRPPVATTTTSGCSAQHRRGVGEARRSGTRHRSAWPRTRASRRSRSGRAGGPPRPRAAPGRRAGRPPRARPPHDPARRAPGPPRARRGRRRRRRPCGARAPGATTWRSVCSRPVAGLWMHLASPGLVDRVEAVVGADAGPDPVLVARGHLGDEVRVGHLGAGHPDQVEQPVADRVPRGGDVGDPGGVHHRDVRPRA